MRVFITGVSDVGKTTIGKTLAELLGVRFFDLDEEVETFFGTSIGRLQKKHISGLTIDQSARKVLDALEMIGKGVELNEARICNDLPESHMATKNELTSAVS